jgi:hypothetical protein
VENSIDRVRALLEAAAAELESRREDVLSRAVIWPDEGLDADDCAAFLLAIDEQLAVLDGAGYVTTPGGRFPLLSRLGVGVGVDVARMAQVGSLAPQRRSSGVGRSGRTVEA